MEKNNLTKAFTLAEVLVTLSILGVLAVMTVPGIVRNYKKKITVTKLQKAYAELEQLATNISVNSDCIGKNLNCTDLLQYTKSSDQQALTQQVFNLAMFNGASIKNDKTINIYPLSYEKDKNKTIIAGGKFYLIKPKGNQYALYFRHNDTGFVNPCALVTQDKVYRALSVYIITEPNKTEFILGRNAFIFLIHDNFVVSPSSYTSFSKYCPAGTGDSNQIQKIDSLCSVNSSNSKAGISCAGKIIRDGWKINY